MSQYFTFYSNKLGTPVVDNAAQNFISAAGIVDSTQQSAITSLVINLKSANIWNKMQALYPIIGGNMISHSYNLKDTNTFRISFNSGSHDNNGYLPNSAISPVNYYGTDIINNTLHLALYSLTNTIAQWDMGVVDSERIVQAIIINRGVGLSASDIGDDNTFTNGTNNDGRGFYIGTRINPSNHKFFKNGVLLAANFTTTPIPIPTSPASYSIGGANSNAGQGAFSNKKIAFASIGEGLTEQECIAYTNIVQQYQTTLNRAV